MTKQILVVFLLSLSYNSVAQRMDSTMLHFIDVFEEMMQTGNVDLMDSTYVSLEHYEAVDNMGRDLKDSHIKHLEMSKESFTELREDLLSKNADLSAFTLDDRLITLGSQMVERQLVFNFTYDRLTYRCMGIIRDSKNDRVVFTNGFMWQFRAAKSRK